MLTRLWNLFGRRPFKINSESNRPKRRQSQRTLRCESLERREMHAVIAGESVVNSSSQVMYDRYQAATASAPDGRSVVVWTHRQGLNDTDIRAQLYDRTGKKAGAEISVAASIRNERNPDVSMDNAGNFVVTWEYEVSFINSDIQAARFTNLGVVKGSIITVASLTSKEFDPTIASDARGNFVVAWTREYSVYDLDIKARMFRDDGIAVAEAFTVANSSTMNEMRADVARAPDGRFAISYQIGDIESNPDIMLKLYSGSGLELSTLSIATGSAVQTHARVAMDSNANIVVVWRESARGNSDIKARSITSSGILGDIKTVVSSTDEKIESDVAMKRDGKSYVVTHYNLNRQTIHVTELTLAGAVRRTERVASLSPGDAVAITFGDASNYSIVYSKFVGNERFKLFRRRGRLT